VGNSPFGSNDSDADVNIPQWARVTAQFTDTDTEELLSNTPQKPPVPRRGLGRKRTGKDISVDSQPVSEAVKKKGNSAARMWLRRWSGGRWVLLVIRIFLALLVLIFVTLGVARLVNPVPIDEDTIVASLEQRLDIVEFPIQAGERIAAQYVTEYFTWNNDGRNENLLRILPTNADFSFRPTPENNVVSMTVIQGPYLLSRPEIISATNAVFTFTVEVGVEVNVSERVSTSEPIIESSTQWLTVSVPVGVGDNTEVSLAAPLSIVPQLITYPEIVLTDVDVDKELSDAAKQYLTIYFEQWAAATRDEPVSSAYLLSDRSSEAATYGLNGTVELIRVNSVQIPVSDTPAGESEPDSIIEKQADVFLTWKTVPTGITMSANYRLDLIFRDGYWYVIDIRGGSFTLPK
jgi:hypothetical protein